MDDLTKCTIYSNRIVTDEPQKIANDTYKAFGMSCPESVPIVDGRFNLSVPEANSIPKETRKRTKLTKEKTQAATVKVPKKRGRPKGSKNKKTLEREAMQQKQPIKRHRGRPKGSKNKPKAT